MNKKNRLIIFLIMLLLTGCSTKNQVESLMEEGKYGDAKSLILKDEKKYGKYLDECNYNIAKEKVKSKDYISAYNLLNNNKYNKAKVLVKKIADEYNNQASIKKLEREYKLLKKDQEEKNKGKSFDDDFVEGSDYFMELGEHIHSLGDGANYNNQRDLYNEIFNKFPNSQEEAKNLIDNINNYVIWDLNRFPIYFINRIFVIDDVCSSTVTNEDAVVSINDMHKFLVRHQISEKSFAYMLDYLSIYGPEFNFDKNEFSIRWVKSDVNRGYYFCTGTNENEENTEEYKWFEDQLGGEQFGEKLEIISEGNKNDICKLNISNNQFDFRTFALQVLWLDENENVIGQSFNKSDSVHKTGISYTFEVPSEATGYIYYSAWNTYE